MIPVFVYGTLRTGEANSHLLMFSEVKDGLVKLSGYDMHAVCDSFPGITEGTGEVIGEVALVDEMTLATLDILEGVPHFYNRKEVKLSDGSTAFVYVLPKSSLAQKPKIPDGDWVKYRKSL